MSQPKPTILCLGAAGFIGSAACRYYRDRYHIVAVDDLSRGSAIIPGIPLHVMDACVVPTAFQEGGFDVVLHLAAQVSVVKSMENPMDDFERNAELTLKLARWAARVGVKTFIYASTNKVYGSMVGRIPVPVSDDEPINPQTPYGISKACGGMYVRDFLPDSGFDFRQSCIMGDGQDLHSTEDQGWIGYLIRQIRDNRPITCFGDGNQVRDLLHVRDLLRAYDLAIGGKIMAGSYTVGGGLGNTVSFREAVGLLGGTIDHFAPPRRHDQQYFCALSDGLTSAGWSPEVSTKAWLRSHARVVV